MPIKRKVLAAAAALATATGLCSFVGPQPASGNTPECGEFCISIFSSALGSYGDLNYVEAVQGGEARIGAPMIMRAADGSDTTEDLLPRTEGAGKVSDFHAVGMVSDAVNDHYGSLSAAQIEYRPGGANTELCVGLASDPHQGQGLTLQPCDTPGRTVWIVDPHFAPQSAPTYAYLPIVNGATTNFSRPYAMDLPRDVDPSEDPEPQIVVRHLRYTDKGNLPATQLWGFGFGPLG